MKGKQLAYRPDIDGLRAVAVILVLLFHFDLGVSGGFIGVDVFFVISGYLITEVIRNGITAGKFTFHDFYIRRLLRLHPALLVTVAATLGAGFLLMDPASFADLAESSKYATFSASNFYFWLNQNYFDASAQTKPLLHTWSLAAEWQFYLIWPLIIWVTMNISQKALPLLLVALTIASLAASQWMLGLDSSAAYFMMPFRVFELSIGAFLVFMPAKRLTNSAESVIALTGIFLIIASAFLLTDKTPFPGFAALLPCLGAAACIYAGQSSGGTALRLKPITFLGLISYSVYLVHWPLIVFYKYYVFREISELEKLALLLTSLLAGSLLYYSIEKAFISKNAATKAIGISILACTSALALYACIAITDSDGMKSRIPAEHFSFTNDPKNYHINNYGGHGYKLNAKIGDKTGKEFAILAGDSFALQYAYGLDRALRDSNHYIQGEFQHGCFISKSYTRLINNAPVKGCKEAYESLTKLLSGNSYPLIIAQHWYGYKGQLQHNGKPATDSNNNDDYEALLLGSLSELRITAGDRPMIIIGSQPIGDGGSPGECLLRPGFVKQPCETLLSFKEQTSKSESINRIISEFAHKTKNTYFIDPASAICRDGDCFRFDRGKILYSDSVHLSKEGSLQVADWLAAEIRKVSKY